MILAFLTSRLGSLLSAGLAVVLGLALVLNVVQLHAARSSLQKMQTTLAAARADLNTCHANVSTLEGALKAQNEAVAALKAEGDARVAQTAKAVSAARAVAESARREAGRVLAAKPRGGDACSSADRLIEEVVG